MRRFRLLLQNYLNSGWEFSSDEYLQKYRFRLINAIFIVAFIALIQGVTYNLIAGYDILVFLDVFMIVFFLVCIYLLRRNKKNYDPVTDAIAFATLLLFNALILFSTPEDIKLVWCFFYVVTFMFLKGNRAGLSWIIMFMASLMLVQFQPFVTSHLDMLHTIYLVFVLSIVTATTYFFQRMIDRGYATILKQNRQLEERMETIKRQEKMMIDQSRLAAMGEMTRMIAHQWRQPLSTTTLRISNYQITAMLSKHKARKIDALLQEISDTLSYLSNTIDDFQNYFKPDGTLGSCAICDILKQAIDLVMLRLEQSGIRVTLTCNDNIRVKANANEFKQIVLNILNNAIDAIESAQNRERNIAIEVLNDEAYVQIRISDTGAGIAEDMLENLFDPYFSTKGKNGTGLGLYMVKMIVENQFGGEVWAENATHGAVFILRLFKADAIMHSDKGVT